MDSEILQGFIKQAEDYLPTIRGGILVCAQEGNTFGELDNALRQIVSLKEAADIIGLDEIAEICTELEGKLAIFSGLKQPMTDKQSHRLLDKLTELEALLTKIRFSADDFSDNIADFVEESFGQLGFNQPEKEVFEEAAEFEIDEDIFSEEEFSEEEFEIDEEMLEIFALEAEDLVRSISVNLEVLFEKPNDREALLEIRRNAHTLKGSAGIIGLKKLSEVAHRVEDLLDFLAENDIASNDKIFELLLTSTDCFEALASGENSEQLTRKIARIYDNFDEIMASLQKEAEQISAVSASETDSDEEIPAAVENNETVENQVQSANNQPRSVVRVSLEKLDDLVKIVSDLVISRSVFEQRLIELEQQIKELHNSTRRLQSSTNKLETDFEADMLNVQSPKSKVQSQLRMTNDELRFPSLPEFDTLEFDRYTEFHQTTRELVETTGDTSAINAELDLLKSNLEMLFDNQRRLIEDMQDKLLRLRMVYFGSLSVRLQRTVRVTCDEEGKSAELFIEGENLEVDTQILDSLIEPLLHLIRNAVAHGIESPETRRLLGKPEDGKISLRVYSEGTHIIVVISDDGRGISASALKDKAVQNGLITKEKAVSMSEDEAFSLIFLPGLTTAEKLSQVSGRGIGMNIVKTGIERQSGTISLTSEAHKGTTFTLRLPMALAVTRALLVKAAGQTFAFPLNLVKHISEISAEYLKKDKNSIRLGDVNYKVLHLNELLNMPFAAGSNNGNIPLLLIDILENPCALIVDSIVKTEEIVIKPLGNPLQNLAELLGATILGDGSVVPVLDLIYLLNSKFKVQSSKFKIQNSSLEDESKIQKVLIVDDSPSVRHLTSNIIKNAGWTAIVAKDGLEALEILQDERELPAVILTDVEMPRMDGYELLASLKRQENLRDIPVVMITSRAGDKHRQKALQLGVSEYLAKPFDDSKLVEIIKNLNKHQRVKL
ncbi:MAG: hybrid sensor histidine kinase/response regulator [Pyrinomonadaceae bacterium]